MDWGKNEHVKRMLTTADTASGREDAAKRTRNALSPINFSPTPRKLASPLWTRANVKSMISITTCTSTNSIIKWRGLVTHTRLWMWGALPAAVVIARYILDAYCSWQQGDKYTSLDIVINAVVGHQLQVKMCLLISNQRNRHVCKLLGLTTTN